MLFLKNRFMPKLLAYILGFVFLMIYLRGCYSFDPPNSTKKWGDERVFWVIPSPNGEFELRNSGTPPNLTGDSSGRLTIVRLSDESVVYETKFDDEMDYLIGKWESDSVVDVFIPNELFEPHIVFESNGFKIVVKKYNLSEYVVNTSSSNNIKDLKRDLEHILFKSVSTDFRRRNIFHGCQLMIKAEDSKLFRSFTVMLEDESRGAYKCKNIYSLNKSKNDECIDIRMHASLDGVSNQLSSPVTLIALNGAGVTASSLYGYGGYNVYGVSGLNRERWSRKTEQVDKSSLPLNRPENRLIETGARHEQKTPPKSFTGIQSAGGIGGRSRRKDPSRDRTKARSTSHSDQRMAQNAIGASCRCIWC
jgi:hypothetical protein